MDSLFGFGHYEFDARRFELRGDAGVVHVEPKVFDLLLYLIVHRDRVVTKAELLDNVWGDRFVSESALTTRLKAARRVVGDDGARQAVIRTVLGRGYQFVAPVTVRSPISSAGAGLVGPSAGSGGGPEPVGRPAPAAAGRCPQEIRYCRAPDGVRIAYASAGHGSTLVKAANWMTHLDLEWTSPVWSHWLELLAGSRRLVRYDERGCGLSDWDVGPFGFDDWLQDLATVVEASAPERFSLLGLSQGGAVAIAYAAAHPERVSRLVLVGAYARGRMVRARTTEQKEEASLDIDLARVAWRRHDDSFFQVFASQFLPEASPELRGAFNELQRSTTSPDNAGRFLDCFAHIDVSSLLSRIRCPTLVVHARRDHRVPVGEARELASHIPDSRLVVLDSGNHLLTADEPAWATFERELAAFLADD